MFLLLSVQFSVYNEPNKVKLQFNDLKLNNLNKSRIIYSNILII